MITSTSNARIKNLVHLKKNARARKQEGAFLVEGPRMFFEVPKDRILEAYVTKSFEEKYKTELAGCSYELITDEVCRRICDTKTPQGAAALVRRDEIRVEDLLDKSPQPFLILLENLQDPGNLGTIIRTAEAAGADGIIMNEGTVDPYNPKVIRSTMGAIFRVPIISVPDFPGLVKELGKRGVHVYAAHLQGKTFYEYDYREASAFLIGNEGNGLSDEISSLAERKIRIPMKGSVESLNASVAATIIMFETVRQRSWT